MKTKAVCITLFVLALVLFLGTSTEAQQLPKEGTFNAVYSGVGTVKASAVGKEQVLFAWEENGASTGKGIVDHTTWHCWGVAGFTKGVGNHFGYCVVTDPSGDQIVGEVSTKNVALDAKSIEATGKFTSGTGKFAGITGGWTYLQHGPEFRPPSEGAYISHGPFEGSYKLP
jgi:hypothetical protein